VNDLPIDAIEELAVQHELTVSHHARCISCMFFAMAAETACSSSLGLNWTYSLPA
jgi:hypothetical protein